MKDIQVCLAKAVFFGATIAIVSCTCGYLAKGGAKGSVLLQQKPLFGLLLLLRYGICCSRQHFSSKGTGKRKEETGNRSRSQFPISCSQNHKTIKNKTRSVQTIMSIKVTNLVKKFDDKTVIDNVSFNVKDGEVLAIVGFSGSGKSTVLKIICDLISHDSGQIETSIGDVSMVFQYSALFDSLNVFNNIAFALKERKNSGRNLNKNIRGNCCTKT